MYSKYRPCWTIEHYWSIYSPKSSSNLLNLFMYCLAGLRSSFALLRIPKPLWIVDILRCLCLDPKFRVPSSVRVPQTSPERFEDREPLERRHNIQKVRSLSLMDLSPRSLLASEVRRNPSRKSWASVEFKSNENRKLPDSGDIASPHIRRSPDPIAGTNKNILKLQDSPRSSIRNSLDLRRKSTSKKSFEVLRIRDSFDRVSSVNESVERSNFDARRIRQTPSPITNESRRQYVIT